MVSLFYLLVLVLLDCHVELKLFLQELLVHKEGSGRQRFGGISVLLQLSEDVRLEKVMLIEDVLFVLFLIEIAIIVALSTD